MVKYNNLGVHNNAAITYLGANWDGEKRDPPPRGNNQVDITPSHCPCAVLVLTVTNITGDCLPRGYPFLFTSTIFFLAFPDEGSAKPLNKSLFFISVYVISFMLFP